MEEVIRAQLKKSREKLRAARMLLKDDFYDDVVSRTYYALYHAASALLLAEEITIKSHSGLKTMFGLKFVRTGKIEKKYGRWLNDIQDYRENGDYDIMAYIEKRDAEDVLAKGEKFFARIVEVLEEEYGIK